MQTNASAIYAPAPGTKAAIGLAHIRAKHPEAVSATDLEDLLGCDSKNVANNLSRCLQYGLIVVEKDGNRNHYRMTDREAINTREPSELSEAQLQAYAKRAVIMLRNTTKSSVDLAAWCDTTPAIIDKALAKLSEEGKLVRVNVLRGGAQMFDYRWGATYVPHDADFDGPVAASVPTPSIQPVADKVIEKPKKATGSPTNPSSPWRKEGNLKLPGSPDLKPRDALATGADLGKTTAEPIKVPEFKQDAETMLGWQVEKASAPQAGLVPKLVNASDDIPPGFTISNTGQLLILADTGEVELEARHALALKRFLDNTSILEELAAGGAL